MSGLPNPDRILEAFETFAKSLDLDPDLDRRFEVGGLCFLPMRAPRALLPRVSEFAFMRTAREMPGLRTLIRGKSKFKPFPVSLPTVAPLDKQLRAAIFDGGLPANSSLKPFAQAHEPTGVASSVDEYVDHGTAVTSAVLFGPLIKGETLSRPYGIVDHYRVLDSKSQNDPYELYDTLARIRDMLQSRKYAFVNLSIGPALSVEDYDVHAWTAVLDELLSNGETLATVAIGNEGEKDWESGNARVQVPSDSVNSLAVGAADRLFGISHVAIAESGARVAYPTFLLPGPRPAVRVSWANGRKHLSLPIREPSYIVDHDRARALAFCQTPGDAVALGGDVVYVVDMASGRSREVPIAGVPLGWGLTVLQASCPPDFFSRLTFGENVEVHSHCGNKTYGSKMSFKRLDRQRRG